MLNLFSSTCFSFIGTADYTQNPCPIAHFCDEGILTAEPCPAGTYRNQTGARGIFDCHVCPAGNYCPNMSTSFLPCSNGSYCPNGTAQPSNCVAGFYCPEAKLQIPCPPGFYCPHSSEKMIRCPKGHYCPGSGNCNATDAGTVVPKICPSGKLGFLGFVCFFKLYNLRDLIGRTVFNSL